MTGSLKLNTQSGGWTGHSPATLEKIMATKFIIKTASGSYYEKWTGIGPAFGSCEEEAMRFDTSEEALREMGRHYGFTMAYIETVEDENGN